MAKAIDIPIESKATPWEGYAGSRVEEYIKGQLDLKAGVFYTDSANNKVLVFADETNRDLYLEDPQAHAGFLIAALDIPSEYRAIITLVDTPSVNYIAYGAVGNYIRAVFDTVNSADESVGENVNVTVTIRSGSSTRRIARPHTYGTQFVFSVDGYLSEGTNNITIGIVGENTLAATTVGVTYHAITLRLSDSLDISRVYTGEATGSNILSVPFSLAGSGVKHLEWYVDGQKLPYEEQDDITALSVTRTKYINLNRLGLGDGRHNLQYRAFIELEGGTKFYSDTLWRDFVLSNGYLSVNVIMTGFSVPASYGINTTPLSEPIPLHGAEQYVGMAIQYAVFSPLGDRQIAVALAGEQQLFEVENGVVYEYRLAPYSTGTQPLVFTLGATTLIFNAEIIRSPLDLEEITGNLVFAFSGNDRTNDSAGRDFWAEGDISATFSGFLWTPQSGWTRDGLVIPDGASLSFNFAPMSGALTSSGATFEFEYETRHVTDDDAVICDLMSGGAGIRITASEAIVSSVGGATLSRRFKSGENIRVAFVVNRAEGVPNRALVFVYINGILSGAVAYDPTDSFTSSKQLSLVGSPDAIMVLKYMRFYDRALDMDEILNNFNLYRPTVEQLVATYNANDILGTVVGQPDYEKVAAQLPVIIITGDVDELQHFTRDDKGTYRRMQKIEIINMQDPSRNLTLINASMRCQGTSSMDYPRKNFRFYLQKDSADTTVPAYTTQVFDAEGNELLAKDRLYSFKEGAQPVKTFCLKADYAESSATHNTGVARLWNSVMKNARVPSGDLHPRYFRNTDYPCRTQVQQVAADSGYEYDVRTTVDGFPIALFYKETETSQLKLLGRYNFNNDKSTESVFGFCDIDGYDFNVTRDEEGGITDCNVQCWEVVNGDYDINQFLDMSHWGDGRGNGGWQDSFESRYPDDSGATTEAIRAQKALRDVCLWVNSTKGASRVQGDRVVVDNAALMTRFAREKWDHFDVYKLAAYYVYLMRFGAVDQTVKNAMFTCEDATTEHPHWFYINYDNDTINGLSNAGDLRFGYTIDRQTHDGSETSYAYAGHASVLWNNLEADTEFMDIVKVVDQALFRAGLTYSSVIRMFNEEQSAQWSERLHNLDYDYKYIGVWRDRIDTYDQLAKLQGARRTHRQWWLSHRFAIYDAKNATSQYKESSFNFKPKTEDYQSGEYVGITPAVEDQIFGYRVGTNGTENVQAGQKGVEIRFPITDNYYIGGSHFFQNMVYVQKVDLSAVAHHIEEIHLGAINSDIFDSNLTELVVSTRSSRTCTGMTTVDGYDKARYLERFIMCNVTSSMMSQKSLDFSANAYLRYLDLRGSTYLTAITLPDAAPLMEMHLPSSLQTIALRNLSQLTVLDIEDNGRNVRSIESRNTPLLSLSPDWLLSWFSVKAVPSSSCSVYIDSIEWEGLTVRQMLDLATIGQLTLKGQVYVRDIDSETQARQLMEAYGANCFQQSADLWIRSTTSLAFLSGPAELNEGETAKYTFACITEYPGTITYAVATTRAGVSIDVNSGVLTTSLNDAADTRATITAVYTYRDVTLGSLTRTMQVTIRRRTYPTSGNVSINGLTAIASDTTYTSSIDGSFTGIMTHQWELTGDILTYARIGSDTYGTCVINVFNNQFVFAEGTLRYTLYKTINGTTTVVCSVSRTIALKSGDIAVLRAENQPLVDFLYSKFGPSGTQRAGVLNNPNYISKTQARSFIDTDFPAGTSATTGFLYPIRNTLTSLDVLEYFTGLTVIPAYFAANCANVESFNLPPNIETINNFAFDHCSKLTGDLVLPESCRELKIAAFQYTNFSSIRGDGVTAISGDYAFGNNQSLKTLWFPELIKSSNMGLLNTQNLEVLYTPKLEQFYGGYGFSNYNSGLSNHVRWTIGPAKPQNVYAVRSVPVGWTLVMSRYATETPIFTDTVPADATADSGNPYVAFEVEEGNTTFEVRNGCLVNLSNGQVVAIPNVASVAVPATTKIADNAAKGNCRTTSLTLPNGLVSIGNQSLRGCSKLTTVAFPSTLVDLGTDCMSNCHSLVSLDFPASATTFGANCFATCARLSDVTFRCTGNMNFGTWPFNGCTAIESIGPLTGSYAKPASGKYNIKYAATAQFPAFGRYSQNANWTSVKFIVIASTITSIAAQAMYVYTNVTSFYCYAQAAPSVPTTWPAGFARMGMNTKDSGENRLYVPANAAGYDSGYWKTDLVDTNNYTVMKTL